MLGLCPSLVYQLLLQRFLALRSACLRRSSQVSLYRPRSARKHVQRRELSNCLGFGRCDVVSVWGWSDTGVALALALHKQAK
jgi:hypothetical protein